MDTFFNPNVNWPANILPALPGCGDTRSSTLRAWLQNTVAMQSNEATDVFSDEQLVALIVNKGSQPHFRMLVARYQSKVHSIALSVLGPARQSDAEDVAQEVFVKIYRQLDGFRGQSKFSTWLYRIAINLSIDHQRKLAKYQGDDPEKHPEASSSYNLEYDQMSRQQSNMIIAAIAKLDRRQQVIIRLFYWQGFKTREIAEVLGTPEGTIKVYLLRARQRLAPLLKGLKE